MKFEFIGGFNLTHAHSTYLICMRFIRINAVSVLPTYVTVSE